MCVRGGVGASRGSPATVRAVSPDHRLTPPRVPRTNRTQPRVHDAQYHKGFREQVAKWPRNPLDEMIEWVQKQPRDRVVADFGCGEARLAASVPHKVRRGEAGASLLLFPSPL